MSEMQRFVSFRYDLIHSKHRDSDEELKTFEDTEVPLWEVYETEPPEPEGPDASAS